MSEAEAETSGCVRPAGDVADNKYKDVINACYNILQAQKCISPCVLPPSPPPALALLSYQIFYFDSNGDIDYILRG